MSTKLAPHERLALLIGEVCLADVEVEAALGQAYQALLRQPSELDATRVDDASLFSDHVRDVHRFLQETKAVPIGIGSLPQRVRACKRLVRSHSDFTVEQREWMRQAFVAADAAHRERTRVVHDRWLADLDQRPDDAPRWWRVRQLGAHDHDSVQTTLDDVRAVRDELRRCHFRVHMIPFTFPFFKPDSGTWEIVPMAGVAAEGADEMAPLSVSTRTRYVDIPAYFTPVAGQFELMPDGGARPHSALPDG